MEEFSFKIHPMCCTLDKIELIISRILELSFDGIFQYPLPWWHNNNAHIKCNMLMRSCHGYLKCQAPITLMYNVNKA